MAEEKKKTKKNDKKTSTKKKVTSEKKKNTSKKSVNVVEKTTDKKEKKVQEKENFFTSVKFLKIVFFILLIVVLVLGVMVYKAYLKDKKETHADIVIPVMKSGDEFAFNINAYELSKSNEYVFKITNYTNKKINSKKTSYRINIMNNTDSVISVTKNSSERNLMEKQKSTIVKEVIESSKERDIFFHVKVKSSGKLSKNDLIAVRIES